jgi:hypothetical protein
MNHRAKGVAKVKTINLREPFSHKSCLMSFSRPIKAGFYFENPATANHIMIVRPGNKSPSIIFLQSLNLIIHDWEPFKLFCSRLKPRGSLIARRAWKNQEEDKTIKAWCDCGLKIPAFPLVIMWWLLVVTERKTMDSKVVELDGYAIEKGSCRVEI